MKCDKKVYYIIESVEKKLVFLLIGCIESEICYFRFAANSIYIIGYVQ